MNELLLCGGFFALGLMGPLFVLAVRKEVRARARCRCTWCDVKMLRGRTGVCDDCLKGVAGNEAAPEDWPRA